MKIVLTITEDNYNESKLPLTVSDEKLEGNWIHIEFDGKEYSVLRPDLENFCRGILAMKTPS